MAHDVPRSVGRLVLNGLSLCMGVAEVFPLEREARRVVAVLGRRELRRLARAAGVTRAAGVALDVARGVRVGEENRPSAGAVLGLLRAVREEIMALNAVAPGPLLPINCVSTSGGG